ncbi:acyloxyacyl hydrolase [Oceanospirillum maris]|uniref:acyloxyacyl hydrolase n=1 Tax=Oceanospirillum maris TaxID=64977 RepID=UPI000421FF3F|nr:acyloxyacyl hydrolase [Oceanospirillum maris]
MQTSFIGMFFSPRLLAVAFPRLLMVGLLFRGFLLCGFRLPKFLLLCLLSVSITAQASEPPSSVWRLGIPIWVGAVAASNVVGADSFSLGSGSSGDIISNEITLRWNQDAGYKFSEDFWLTSYKQFSYTMWQVEGETLSHETSNNTLDFIQGFRWNFANQRWLSYADTSLGFSLLANDEVGRHKLGDTLQFTEYTGIGGYFSPRWQWDFGVRHYSNNYMYKDNNGINFYRFILSYNYQQPD